MKLQIKYINHKNFLFEEKSEEDLSDESFINFDLQLSDVFNTDYIKEKLKELLFQQSPDFINASKQSLELIFFALIELCKFLANKITQSISNIREGITTVFNQISNVISHIFGKSEYSNLNLVKFYKFFFEYKDLNKKIAEKIEKIDLKFEIKYSDLDKINKLCELGDTKIFALEMENNYLCLPFDDEKVFKRIAIANYYDLYFEINNQESSDLLDMLLEYKEKGTNSFNKKIGNTPEFNYYFLDDPGDINWTGFFSKEDKAIYVIIKNNLSLMYTTLVHEFIHYKDYLLTYRKFTNHDFQNLIEKLTVSFKKDQIISQNTIASALEINKSTARYLIAILEKQGYIEYDTHDFTKIKIISLPKYNTDLSHQDDIHYYNSSVELNTKFSNIMNKFITGEKFPIYLQLQNKKNATMDNNDEFSIFKYYAKYEADSPIEEFKFSNDEYKKIKEYIDKNRGLYEEKIRSFRDLFDNLKDDQKFDLQKNLKLKNKLINSNFIKGLKFKNNTELLNFLNRFNDQSKTNIFSTLASIIYFNLFYKDAYELKYNKEDYIKRMNENLNELVEKYLQENVSHIFDEIVTKNKEKFNNIKEEEKLYQKILNNYIAKFKEKLNNYIQNKNSNKEKFGKLEN